jgi:hypothetical protein
MSSPGQTKKRTLLWGQKQFWGWNALTHTYSQWSEIAVKTLFPYISTLKCVAPILKAIIHQIAKQTSDEKTTPKHRVIWTENVVEDFVKLYAATAYIIITYKYVYNNFKKL